MRGKIGLIAFLTVALSAGVTVAQGDAKIPAVGEFAAIVDFETLALTPVGANCLLEVSGRLEFSGTLVGSAPGTTRALVFAGCPDVASNPPGAFRDVFMSQLEFVGTVDGVPIIADLTYQGNTEVGGDIVALMRLSSGVSGHLEVDARVAEGGTYGGFVTMTGP